MSLVQKMMRGLVLSREDKLLLEAAYSGYLRPYMDEGPNWVQTGNNKSYLPFQRRARNDEAERLAILDPTIQQAIRLHNAYTFGRGVTMKASDPKVSEVLTAFWTDVRNRKTVTGVLSQWRLNATRQKFGEITLLLHVSKMTGRVVVFPIDSDQIVDVIYDPSDPIIPKWYKRKYREQQPYNPQTGERPPAKDREVLLPDFRNAEPEWVPPLQENGVEIYVFHVVTNEYEGRGLTHLSSAIPWSKALRGFMEDRVTLTLALATFAFKAKVKGNKKAVDRLISRFQEFESDQRYGQSDEAERRQGGTTWIQNEAIELEQMRVNSQAYQAYQDARLLRQLIGVGAGSIFEHYLSGDPSTGNLASHTAMELPMLKVFEFWQQVWSEILLDLLTFVMIMSATRGELKSKVRVTIEKEFGIPTYLVQPDQTTKTDVDLIFPNIVQADLGMYAQAIASIKGSEQASGKQILPPRETALTILRVLGFNEETSEILSTMEENGFDLDMGEEEKEQEPGGNGVVPEQLVQNQFGPEQAPELGEQLAEALIQKFGHDEIVRRLAELSKGKVPDKDEITTVEPFTEDELDQVLADWLALPELDELIEDEDLDPDLVEEAARA